MVGLKNKLNITGPQQFRGLIKLDNTIPFLKQNTLFIFKSLLVLIVPLVLYFQDLVLLVNEALNNEISSHILAIPFLLIYLLYRIRKYVFVTSTYADATLYGSYFKRNELLGSLMCLMAYLMKWYGSYTFIPLEIHMLSFTLFIAGIVLLVFNWMTLKALIFPILFLSLLIPLPIDILQPIGSTLSIFSSEAAYYVLKLAGLPVELSVTFGSPIIMLTTSNGVRIPFAIDIACSGLYSLIGFLLFSVFIAYISRGSIFKKILIFFLGFPLIYFMNILRIIAIVLIGFFSGPNFALNLFHMLGGWTLIFIGTLILFLFAEKVLKVSFFRNAVDKCSHLNLSEDKNYCIDCGKILSYPHSSLSIADVGKYSLILIVLVPLIFFQVPVFTLTESAAEVLVQKSSGERIVSNVLPEIDGYNLNFVLRDRDFEEVSGQDASLFYEYDSKDEIKSSIWVGLEIGDTKGCLHAWEVCYITSPESYGWTPKVDQLDLRDIHLLENPPLTARFFVFKNKESSAGQVILYWYTRSYFQIFDGYDEKWVKISVIQIIDESADYRKIENELIPIGVAIAEYWGPISEWSVISLDIAKNGLFLMTIAGTLFLGVLITFKFQDFNNKRSMIKAYNNLTFEDQQLIISIKDLTENHAIERNILLKYQDVIDKNVDLDILSWKLKDAENIGLLKRKIKSICDKPYFYWDVNFNL